MGLSQPGGGAGGWPPNVLFAELNTPIPTGFATWEYDTFYDDEQNDITGSETAALAAIGLTYAAGIFTATEPGAWAVTPTFGAVECPEDQLNQVTLETLMSLNDWTIGWDAATMPFSPGGGTRVNRGSQLVYLQTGETFKIRQTIEGDAPSVNVLTDYVIIAITRVL